ncbi:E3 SUMO-protein ligase PIAS1 [Gryllus bimaculatus]|nr:E3 SUMO-protein ligase PIAS1 [Gryllus bimaculatus]
MHKHPATSERDVYKELECIVMSFRVPELQALMSFAGYQKTGVKKDLQAKAIELVRLRSPRIAIKVKQIYAASILTEECKAAKYRRTPYPHHPWPQQHTIPRSNEPNPIKHILSNPPTSSANIIDQKNDVPTVTRCDSPMLHVNVKLRKLPFYEILSELVQPSLLNSTGSVIRHEDFFFFRLTAEQANCIGINRQQLPGNKMTHKVQVQMRFCSTESHFKKVNCCPSGMTINVNGTPCQIPLALSNLRTMGSQSLDITPLIHISPLVSNTVTMTWLIEQGKSFATAIYLVRQLTYNDLLKDLLTKVLPESDTIKLIQSKFGNDLECTVTSQMKVPLVCPLGKVLMNTPCRATTCNHLQCFDACLYLQMNEKKPTWTCPVCQGPAEFDNLVIDSFFTKILKSEKINDSKEIQLHLDGSWTFLADKQQPQNKLNTCVNIKVKDFNSKTAIANQPTMSTCAVKQMLSETTCIDLTNCDSD